MRSAHGLLALLALASAAAADQTAAPTALYLRAGTVNTADPSGLALSEAARRATAADRFVIQLDGPMTVGSSRVDLQACKLEYSIVSPK